MLLLHEKYVSKGNQYTLCTLGENTTQIVTTTDSLRKNIQRVIASPEQKKVLLLDEQKFSRVATPVHITVDHPCTIQDMYEKVDTFLQKQGGHDAEKLFYHIDEIFVNGVATPYYIGKQGDIRCMVHIISLHRDDWYLAKSALGKHIDRVHLYPASFFTLHHIKQQLHKQEGNILYIGKEYTKCVAFSQGVYQHTEVIDLGWQTLKDIYSENTIQEYFDQQKSTIENNAYAKDVVNQSVQFYVAMIMRRLRSYNPRGDIFLVSDLVQNEFFMDHFARLYQQDTHGFVVPLAHIKGLKTYGRERGQEDIDMQTAAHYFV